MASVIKLLRTSEFPQINTSEFPQGNSVFGAALAMGEGRVRQNQEEGVSWGQSEIISILGGGDQGGGTHRAKSRGRDVAGTVPNYQRFGRR